jgi:hypothetical protein
MIDPISGNFPKQWSALVTEQSQTEAIAFVPPETARAILLDPVEWGEFNDILVKGSGLVTKFATNNKIRPADKEWNGRLELAEAIRDFIHTHMLEQAGVRVAKAVAVVDHNETMELFGRPSQTANYIRAFRSQTRLSNLSELDPAQRKLAIEEAILAIQKERGDEEPMSMKEYFYFMLENAAKTSAIYQAIGFTQDGLHYQQMSLAGEIVDFGVGLIGRPKPGESNTLYPWFRYERQPILFQNMMVKTHSVKAEPQPVRLPMSSATFQKQESLLGFIRSFDPDLAAEIMGEDPEKRFWDTYRDIYSSFDVDAFEQDVLSRYEEFYNWTPEILLKKLSPEIRTDVGEEYQKRLKAAEEDLERKLDTWVSRGLSSLQKLAIFEQTLQELAPGTQVDTLDEAVGPWNQGRGNYLLEPGTNTRADISFQPSEFQNKQ